MNYTALKPMLESSDGELIVVAGSGATKRDDFSSNTYGALRKQLIDDQRIRLAGAVTIMNLQMMSCSRVQVPPPQ